MIMDDEDKRYIKIISAIARKDDKEIIEVFRATLQAAVKEIHAGNNELVIPGVCKLKIDYYESPKNAKGYTLNVNLEAEARRALIAEIAAIQDGEETPDLRRIKEEIKDTFKLTVDIE